MQDWIHDSVLVHSVRVMQREFITNWITNWTEGMKKFENVGLDS